MHRQRPVILFILIAYIFLPTFLNWVTAPDGMWYKPFVVWALVIIGAIFIQTRKS